MAEDANFMREVDEALRAEKLQQFWGRHSGAILTFCVLAILATASSVLWKNHLRDLHERQTALLASAATFEQKSKNDDAISDYQKVEDQGGPLAALAGLRHAALLVSMKQGDKALALYTGIADTKGEDAKPLRDFAKLQAAILASNQGAGTQSGDPLTGNNIFRQSLAEIGALDAMKAGDAKTSSTLFSGIVSDESSAYSQRLRAAELMDSVKEATK